MKNYLLINLLTILFIQNLFSLSVDKSKNDTRFESLSKFTNVIDIVEKYYVDELNFSAIIDKSLKGLMKELDAHSSHMSRKSFKEMKIQTEGEFGGLGITVGIRKQALTIISPIDDTPAYKAGIKAGDIILKIDDASTLDISLDEAVSKMRGKPKTPIVLTIIRKNVDKPFKVKIIRDIIKIRSVHTKLIDDNILYIRISNFDRNVYQSLLKILKKYDKKEGIILDLRNNPGGLLNQAIDVVDLFIDDGIIVSQKGRNESKEEKFYASSSKTVTKKPLVVLVNEGSASASEIVSGALQDHKRAIIVGAQTFGKGSVQVILPISKDRKEGIKITISKYYLPSGRTIQAKGITPDVLSYWGESVRNDEDKFLIKETDLKKHLKGELQKIDGNSTVNIKEDEEDNKNIFTKKDLEKDNQLRTAADILKSLIILKGDKK
jgi:carboxyl-terminal processing protease